MKCPHCSAAITSETLKGTGDLYCPACGGPLADSKELGGLSSLGGLPADSTMRPDLGEGSGIGGSSFAASGFADSESLSIDPPSSHENKDATMQASDGAPSHDDFDSLDDDLDSGPDNDVTMAFGQRQRNEEDSEDLLLLGGDDDDSDALDDLGHLNNPDGRSPGESLDATVDFGHFARIEQEEADLGGGLAGADMTMAFDGKPNLAPRQIVTPSDSDSAPDLTQMVGVPAMLGGPRPQQPLDATIAADSDKGASDSSLSKSSHEVGRDSGGDRTESPSTHAEDINSNRDSATLAFDSERRSDRVPTPEPLDITGLSSGGTIPRGALERGRGTQMLKPGESQIVGDESVRLRAFELAATNDADPLVIDYAIEGEAGKGGMGVVYKARQQSLNRLVAIKQIKSELGASVSDCNKFISEAVITGQLEHPNIAPVHDLGLASDGLPFYAMKFVEGQDWEDSVKSLSEEENLTILIQVAQAIAFAHSRNVLHRDLKPGNVRLGAFGEVLVMDWGLAARLDEGAEIQPAGTPIYMPPETALEYLDYAKGRVVGKRVESSRRRIPAGKYCDVYLLGALLFKIVTGRAPHRGKTTFECLRAAAKNDIVKVKRSSELLDIAYKAMATDPENRHASALEFIDALKAYQSHAQSIKIAKRASQELRAAETLLESPASTPSEIYACYSRAQHGYQNALELWSENGKARRRLKRTLRNFAEAAYKNGDYDLALSQLDVESAEDAELRVQVLKDQKSRQSRLAWFKTLQYATAASLMLALGFIGYSIVLKQDAISMAAKLSTQETLVEQKVKEANELTIEAGKQRQVAEEQTAVAQKMTNEAKTKTIEVARLEKLAAEKTIAAEEASQLATLKQSEATAAVKVADAKTKEAAEQSYYAALGKIRATLADDGAYAAWIEMQKAKETIPQERANDIEWVSLTKTVEWQSEAEELVAAGADGKPTFATASADGATFVTVADDPQGGVEVAIYRGGAKEGTDRFTLPGVAKAAVLDAQGRYLALVGDGLRVVDLSTKREIKAAELSRATSVAFHPTKAELLVGDADAKVTRWSFADGKLERISEDPVFNDGAITAVGYSPDGRQRFAADAKGRVVLYRTRDGQMLDERETYSHEASESSSAYVTSAAMTDDADGRLAFGSSDGAVYEIAGWWPAMDSRGIVIDAKTGEKRPNQARRIEGSDYLDARPTRLRSLHAGAVSQVAYAEAGKQILSAGGDTLLVQSSPTVSLESEYKTERRYHNAPVTSLAVGPAGFAYSTDEKGRVLRWRIGVEQEQFAVDAPDNAAVVAVSFDAATERLAVADAAGFVHQWSDVTKPAERTTLFAGHSDNRDLQAWRIGGDDPVIVTVAPEERIAIGADGKPRRITANRACLWGGEDGLLRRSIDLGERLVVACDTEQRVLYAACSGRLLDGDDEQAVALAYALDSGSVTPLWTEPARVSAITPLPAGASHEGAVAVGLRDGQVFLWNETEGRVELVRSSVRPHWRPIRSLAYDAASQRLYSGDNNGMIAAWPLLDGQAADSDALTTRLNDATNSSVAPIVGLTAAPDGRLVALQRHANGLVTPFVLDDQLQVVAKLPDALDASIDTATGDLVVVKREAGETLLDAMRLQGDAWVTTADTKTPQRLTKVAAGSGGWLAWGGGVVEWRPSDGGRHDVATRVESRSMPVAIVADSATSGLSALTAAGSLDEWNAGGELSDQRALGLPGRPTAACKVGDADEWLVALCDADDVTRIDRWDADAKRVVGEVASGLRGECSAVATAAGVTIIALGDRVVIAPIEGGGATEIALPANTTAIAARPDGAAFVVVTTTGEALLAEEHENAWRLAPLDVTDVTSAAFTPDGARLLVGVESGRVVLLELDDIKTGDIEGATVTSRTLLTFVGHNDRVVRIDAQPTPEGVSVVSGDASGRVIVRRI
jgi:serine/threonine protein kinase/WD40 repeat protein